MDLSTWIAISYIFFQSIIILGISISGVFYVRNIASLEKEIRNPVQYQSALNTSKTGTNDTQKSINIELEEDQAEYGKIDTNQQNLEIKAITKMGFVKLWFKIVWKMRSIYTSFIVHVFDVLTDILVIIEWWNAEKNGNNIQDVDAKLMSSCAIGVLIFHRVSSSMYFWLKEHNIIRCLMAFLDLLIFQEIYIAHGMIIAQFRNSKSQNMYGYLNTASIDTSTSFKSVRTLEAVFESMPQCILQLVFILRTSELNHYDDMTLLIITMLSIIQSIISMSNSILKNDNGQMKTLKFKKHTRRLPPSLPFLKHALCRISEVTYRIGLLALMWTVCGGKAFSIWVGVEVFCLVLFPLISIFAFGFNITIQDIFVFMQLMILVPTEFVFDYPFTWTQAKIAYYSKNAVYLHCKYIGAYIFQFFVWILCFYPAAMISTCCCLKDKYHHIPIFRIAGSMLQWIFLILYPVFDNTRWIYLLSPQHGLYVFVVSIVCFFIYTQYTSLIPDFTLPLGVTMRSRFGCAFNGELDELKRIKSKTEVQCYVRFDYVDADKNSYEYHSETVDITIKDENDFWDSQVEVYYHDTTEDEKLKFDNVQILLAGVMEFVSVATPAMFALANNHQNIIEWLENDKKAQKHKEFFKQYPTEPIKKMYELMEKEVPSKPDQITPEFARMVLDIQGQYFHI